MVTMWDYHGVELFHLECIALIELEGLLGKSIPKVPTADFNTLGFTAEGGHVTALGLSPQGLSSLPEMIGQLSSLEEILLGGNQLSSLVRNSEVLAYS